MRLLLDTQAFLWFVLGDARLSAPARSAIEDPANDSLLSIASAWEIAIKVSIGKLTEIASTKPLGEELADKLAANAVQLVPVQLDHVARTVTLPFHHRDPFDRLLAAQSLVDALPLVSSDAVFDRYGVTRVW